VNSTLFPYEIGLAATFNPSIAQQCAQVSAYETRAASVPWTFAPVLDSRSPEISAGFGSDRALAGEMAAATVRGYQGGRDVDGYHVLACAKCDVRDAPLLNQFDLLHIEKAVTSGVATVMIGGDGNRTFLADLLKTELQFDGFLVGDLDGIEQLCLRNRIANSPRDALRIAVNAGIDMLTIRRNLRFCDELIELVWDGEVSVERIDDAVRRILKAKARAGLWSTNISDYREFASDAFARVSYEAASESITLLKNEGGVLPIEPHSRIVVGRPSANSMAALGGGDSQDTILRAIQKVNGVWDTVHSPGVRYVDSQEEEVSISEVVVNAASADCVILVLGESWDGGESLSDLQTRLAIAALDVGTPVVVVLVQGSPRILEESIVNRSRAIITTYFPGDYGGSALADVLFGRVNPSGRLPYTYPSGGEKPLFEFGFGLSYTRFVHDSLLLSAKELSPGDVLNISVVVCNMGKRGGKEIVLLFTSERANATDARRLSRFEKLQLEPGESQIVRFRLPADDFSFMGNDNKRVIEPGNYTVSIGNLKDTFILKSIFPGVSLVSSGRHAKKRSLHAGTTAEVYPALVLRIAALC
jgi:beta-glucosidase